MDFKGQIGIVTGGSRGIGKAIAEGLAKSGVNLVVAARNLDAAMPATLFLLKKEPRAILAI